MRSRDLVCLRLAPSKITFHLPLCIEERKFILVLYVPISNHIIQIGMQKESLYGE
jgi:hypothetical protein